MKSCRDWSWLVVPKKIRKILSMNPFQKGIAQMKASQKVSSWRPMKVGIWWGSFGSHGCAYQLEKMFIHE